MTRNTKTQSHLLGYPKIFCFVLVMAAITVSACSQGKKYTWANRFPQDDCNPRTAKAKDELGGCPKLANPQHPTLQEKRQFVNYMNKKNAIEGTILLGDYYPPGCWKWSVNPKTGAVDSGPTGKKGCGHNLEKKLRNYSLP